MTGPEFRELRKKMNLSQIDLAKRLDVNKSTVGEWERGDRVNGVPTVAGLALERLASIDGVIE